MSNKTGTISHKLQKEISKRLQETVNQIGVFVTYLNELGDGYAEKPQLLEAVCHYIEFDENCNRYVVATDEIRKLLTERALRDG